MIQDYIIAFVQWGVAIALIPTLLHKDNKPTFITSIWTGVMIIILATTFATLDLWVGATSSLIVSMEWFTLAYQRYKINKGEGKPLFTVPYWLAFIRF